MALSFPAFKNATLHRAEWIQADDLAFATWVKLAGRCAEEENGGRLAGAKTWTERTWISMANVTSAGVASAVIANLCFWDADSLVLEGYDQEAERKAEAKRQNGQLGGRPKKKTTPKPKQNLPVNLTLTPIPIPFPTPSPIPSPVPIPIPIPGGGDPESPPKKKTIALRLGPVTGHDLQRVFGEIRARDVGGLDWQGVRVANGKESSMADLINADPTARADVIPTIELLFRSAKEGRRGPQSARILSTPSFGFGAWVSDWTPLREEIHGKAPAPPSSDVPTHGQYVHRDGPRQQVTRDVKL